MKQTEHRKVDCYKVEGRHYSSVYHGARRMLR